MPSINIVPVDPEQKPLYALAGAADIAIVDLRKRAVEFQASVKTLPANLSKQALTLQATLTKQAKTLPSQAKTIDLQAEFTKRAAIAQNLLLAQAAKIQAFPAEFPAQAAKVQLQVQKAAEDFALKAISSYDGLAAHGETVVAKYVGDSKPVATKTAPATKPASKPAAKKATTKAAAKPAVKKATTKKSAPKPAALVIAETAPEVVEPVVPITDTVLTTEAIVTPQFIAEAPISE